jgi:hypothetical protein
MGRAIEKNVSRYRFQFRNAEPDPELEKMANLKLAQILALAPSDATAVAMLENAHRYFVSVAEVQSRYRTFQEKAAGNTPQTAVRRALERLEDRLYRWRFGGGTDPSVRPSGHLGAPQVQG